MYRAVDQHGQVIDVLVSARRDATAARRFFQRALDTVKVRPSEVVTDKAPVYPRVIDELVPAAWHHVEQYENNRIEADHGRLKHRLRPMRGLRTDRTRGDHYRRARLRPEPTPRPLRNRHRSLASASSRRRIHRARQRDLTAETPRPAARQSDNSTEPCPVSGMLCTIVADCCIDTSFVAGAVISWLSG